MTTVPPPPRHERTRQVAFRLGIVALIVPALVFTGSSRVIAVGSPRGHHLEGDASAARTAVAHATSPQRIAHGTASSRCLAPGRTEPTGSMRCQVTTFKRAGR